MLDKDHIVAEIWRTAQAHGSKPLGKGRFFAETGIKEADWLGKHWARWGDALRDAGFEPNTIQARHADDRILGPLAALVRELGHFPTGVELKLKRRQDGTFPSHNTFGRYGGRAGLVVALRGYCEHLGGSDDVLAVCATVQEPAPPAEAPSDSAPDAFGEVYLLRSGRFYKIGRTVAVGRSARELAIQLPEQATLVHAIKTDDPPGIEEYWHRRFAPKRKNGEWFELSSSDVQAFRRRRFM